MGTTLEALGNRIAQHPAGSIEDVIDAMADAQSSFRQSGHDHLAYFQDWYHAATVGVARWRDEDRFDEPEQLETSVIDFHGFFVDQILHLTIGDTDKIRPAWRPLFTSHQARSARPVQCQMAGMVAHVQADLPESAIRSGAIHNGTYMTADWDKVNDVLREVAHPLARTSVVLPHRLRFMPQPIQSRLRRGATNMAMDVIADMRDDARHDAEKLYAQGEDAIAKQALVSLIDQRAEKTATAMLRSNTSMMGRILLAR